MTNPAAQSPAPPKYQGSGDELQAARHRKQIRKNLQVIVRGLHTYADVNNGHLPPPASVDKKGTRLLSWRVLILPYIGEEKLHEQFHLDEPWDSKHNKELLAKMPEVFNTSRAKDLLVLATVLFGGLGQGVRLGRPGNRFIQGGDSPLAFYCG